MSGAEADAMTSDAQGPERLCIVTRVAGAATARVRFVLGPDGQVVPDLAAKLPGRGAWILADRATLELALRRKAFARAFKAQVTVAPDLPDRVESLLARQCIDLLGLARRAGQAVAGFGKVEAMLRAGPVGGLLTAAEGAEDGRRKLYGLAGAAPRVEILSRDELGLAFGRESVVHAAIAPGRLADRLVAESRRLAGFRDARGAVRGPSGIDRGAMSNPEDHAEQPRSDGETFDRISHGPETHEQPIIAARATMVRVQSAGALTARPAQWLEA